MPTPIKIPDFQQSRAIVDKEGRPLSDFLRAFNSAIQSLVNNANATNAALEAAGIAQAAAVVAMEAAETAQGAADISANAMALANSYVEGIAVTATDAGANVTVNISAHTRVYASVPPTSVSVNGATITGLAYATQYYFYYDQASRAGGTVTYVASLVSTDVAQVGDRHSVASVLTPVALAAPNNGNGVSPPGGSYRFEYEP